VTQVILPFRGPEVTQGGNEVRALGGLSLAGHTGIEASSVPYEKADKNQ
jgi:hypothetical protein